MIRAEKCRAVTQLTSMTRHSVLRAHFMVRLSIISLRDIQIHIHYECKVRNDEVCSDWRFDDLTWGWAESVSQITFRDKSLITNHLQRRSRELPVCLEASRGYYIFNRLITFSTRPKLPQTSSWVEWNILNVGDLKTADSYCMRVVPVLLSGVGVLKCLWL